MKAFKFIAQSILVWILMVCFFQCATTIQLEKNPPIDIEDVYFQKWNAGIKEGGSGINLLVKTKSNSIPLDSVYFRNKIVKLNVESRNENIYIGRFTSNVKIIDIPFKLDNDDCVISYNSLDGIGYFKLENFKEK